jgi:LmbE family N-acetylglucosaminyl deacetylase
MTSSTKREAVAPVRGEDILFLFAHQDDEVGISTRIEFEKRHGHRVWCAYLTDGASSVSAAVRDAESSAVLIRLGVEPRRIAFLSDDEGRIGDGNLVRHLSRARAMLSSWILSTRARFARIFTMDWEGGHHDHDATHLLALLAARDFEIDTVYGYPFYNAFGRRPGHFRVASFVPCAAANVLRRRLTFGEAFSAAKLAMAYPSQRRTWLGLGPGFVVRTILRREELFRLADTRRVATQPHAGPLLYETLFGIASGEFLELSAPLRTELADAARSTERDSGRRASS